MVAFIPLFIIKQSLQYMINDGKAIEILSFLENQLVDQLVEHASIETYRKEVVLIREGQYLKHVPVILEGMLKVYSQYDGKELLLYYIKPRQSCIISFDAAIYNKPSQIFAITELDSKILLLPTTKISAWTVEFPRLNQLFLDLYHLRYKDLLETINQLVFKSLDQRVYTYLLELSNQLDSDLLNIRHHEIARDLGTAREVVSRIIKKLEKEDKVSQTSNGIKIFRLRD